MTLDLVFVQQSAAGATFAQLAADLGVELRLVAQRITTMEIFPVSVLTVELTAEPGLLEAATRWFAQRGIHRLA
ncbi:NIL domain-containing protein [Propioniciclava soli]|uniref:NIL domain-containing protein n=1 Tax=Propioniciclava soli TaxID=2775081 RepID=A0ABZ3C3U6_9ACTN|nr:NIL domain-containing protein [Propioniciclava soli]